MLWKLILFFSCTQQEPNVEQEKSSGLIERSMSSAMWNTASIDTYQKKVQEIVEANQSALSKRDSTKPLLFIFGSSSSGGGTRGNNMKFWPEILRRELPKLHVQSLARGGATTWHMRKVAEGLNIKADICILYMGYNDRQEKSPKQSIAKLEEGIPPKKEGFVAWVSPQEQKENLLGMQKFCTNFLLVREYVQGQKNRHDRYGTVFQTVPNTRYFDPTTLFTKEDPKIVMMDNIHPTPFGHQILADAIQKEIQDWLP